MNVEHAKVMAATAWITAIGSVGVWLDAGSPSIWLLVSVVALGPATMILYLSTLRLLPVPRPARIARAPKDHGWMSPQWLAEQRSSQQRD